MRIKEKIEKAGYFWLPSASERKIPGTLIIKDGGKIELEVFGLFDESVEGLKKVFNGQYELGRIVGHIEEFGLVTLDECFYTYVPFGGISKSSVHVRKAFLGITYNEKEEILFNTFKFSVEGIDDWVGISGIKVERQFENKTASITYSQPEEISINLNNGMKLLITFSSWTLPIFSNTIIEAKITQKAYFMLVSKRMRPLDDFISSAYKITTLLGFAIDKIVCIDQVSATSNAKLQNIGNSKTQPVSISIYYPSLPYVENEPKIDRYRMLFRFSQIKDDSERIINNWFKAYDKIAPTLNLYFSAKTGALKYVDGKFLALVQGLESYHRRTSNEKLMDNTTFEKIVSDLIEHCPEKRREWLFTKLKYANEIILAHRINNIIEPFKNLFGTSKDRKHLVRKIVDTRNYLTHYDESLKSKAAVGPELLLLCLKMEVIFQLHLLHVVGFTYEQIETIFNNSNELRSKIK